MSERRVRVIVHALALTKTGQCIPRYWEVTGPDTGVHIRVTEDGVVLFDHGIDEQKP